MNLVLTSRFEQTYSNFDVLLTVHLGIILVINQHNAQNLVLQYVYYMPLHVSSTMCSSSGGQNCIIQHLVIITPVGGRPVHRLTESSLNLCTGRPPTGVMIPDAV